MDAKTKAIIEELIEAGGALRYDEWGDMEMDYGPVPKWDEARKRAEEFLAEQILLAK